MTNVERELHMLKLKEFDDQFRNYGVVAGMDEVGRGPLAGNVITACIVLPDSFSNKWIDDSKKISEKRRNIIFEEIMISALHLGIGRVGPEQIDQINILQATRKAMIEAADKVPADCFLIDAVKGLGLKGVEISMFKGDATSYSIAAASIVAKVIRDREMIEYDKIYPEYGFARNKGYGTSEHIAALKKYGPCPIHRRSFIGNFI